MGYLVTLAQAENLLQQDLGFTTGTLSGVQHPAGYTVLSYGVVIATRKDGVLASAYTHSKTTSKHANIVKRAWGLA